MKRRACGILPQALVVVMSTVIGKTKKPRELTDAQIRQIRLGFAYGFNKTELARGYGIGVKRVTKIINKERPYVF